MRDIISGFQYTAVVEVPDHYCWATKKYFWYSLNWGQYKESYLHKRCLKHLFERHFDACWLVSAAAQADRGLLLVIWRRITTENKTQKMSDWVEQADLTTKYTSRLRRKQSEIYLPLSFNI